LLGVDQIPLLLPEAGLNLNLGSYQSDEWGSQVGSQLFTTRSFLLGSPEQELPPLGSTRSGGAWQGQPSWWARDNEPVTRR
jgi:hypothetical protein